MNTKKDSKKVGNEAVNHVEGAQAVGAVHAVPTTVAKPPAGWVEKKGGTRKGRRPRAAQVSTASSVAGEVSGNAAAYQEDFGKKAPDPAQLAASMTLAAQWSVVVEDARAFHAYTLEQNAFAWDHALGLLRVLAPSFAFAQGRDETVGERFPALAKMLAAYRRGSSRKKVAAPKEAPAPAEKPASPVEKPVAGASS